MEIGNFFLKEMSNAEGGKQLEKRSGKKKKLISIEKRFIALFPLSLFGTFEGSEPLSTPL